LHSFDTVILVSAAFEVLKSYQKGITTARPPRCRLSLAHRHASHNTMPNPTENNASSCPRIERDTATLEDPLLRIRRHPRLRRGPDHTGSAQPHARELDCAIPDTKPEELIGIPTPPPSDPESDSGDSSWTRRERNLRASTQEKQDEKNDEEDMVHLRSANSTPALAQSPVVGYDTDAGLAQSMSTASISSLPRYIHYYESERHWVGPCADT
jgi:hypothetical protein